VAQVKDAKKKTRLWGFLVAYGFTPAGQSTRITPPYFKTDRRGLAECCRKAKGATELTPKQMEEYEAAQAFLNPETMKERLTRAVQQDESERAEAQQAAKEKASAANTAAQAAEQRAAEAADRVKELEAAQVKAALVKTGQTPAEDDLFDGEDEGESSGLSLEELETMDEDELSGVLELYSVPVPRLSKRADLLRIAQELVKGNKREEEPAKAE